MKQNNFHGLVIYQPSGKAAEYSLWACNLYNGCTHGCSYCFNNYPITSSVLGGTTVRLKKSLGDAKAAEQFFLKELLQVRDAIIKDGGILFSFVSDPCLPETIDLTWTCVCHALSYGVPCQILTKRADWLNNHHPAVQRALTYKPLLRIGFSLSGCDELEPGASPNEDRISAMRELHQAGISTWASIEPIISPRKSFLAIEQSMDCCDQYKIGILSGKKNYTPDMIRLFVNDVNALNLSSVYFKKSLLAFINATSNNPQQKMENSSTEQEEKDAQIKSSSLNNNVMEETRNSVNTETMPTGQANVQLPSAEGVVVQQENEGTAQEPSFVTTLITLVGDKLPRRFKYVIMYNEAKKAGLKVVFLKGNREIYNAQLEALWKSAKDQKCFSNDCYVVPLRPDLDGNQVTLDSPEVDMCLVVYDGQHRITVCELHPDEIDVQLELNDFDGVNPLETIKMMNSFSKNWSGTDLRVSNVGAGITANQLYEESEKLQDLYGITPKLAEYVLTFQREATKKKDLVEGKDTTIYVTEHGNRGRGIFNAAMTNFNGAKEVKKIEFFDAVVYTYDNVKDSDKPSFARNMKLFLGTLSESECEKVKKLITDKDFGKLMSELNKGYTGFCSAGHTEEALAQMEADVDKAITTYITALQTKNQEKAAKKPLKSGRVHEVIQHNRTVEATIANQKLAKASQKAQEVMDEKEATIEGAASDESI